MSKFSNSSVPFSDIEILAWGKHIVEEALRSSQVLVHEVWVTREREKDLSFLSFPKNQMRIFSMEELHRKLGTRHHQGMGIRASLRTWNSLKHWATHFSPLENVKGIALDGIEDPQNLGSLVRSAHFFQMSFLLLPKDRTAPLNGLVAKVSAGALFSLPIIRCVNLSRELEEANNWNFLKIALEAESKQSLDHWDCGTQNVLLVLGNEGQGIRPLVKKHCDTMLSVFGFSRGRDSLNVAIAGALAMYEVQNKKEKK